MSCVAVDTGDGPKTKLALVIIATFIIRFVEDLRPPLAERKKTGR
jgi:hypothetical protein